MGVKWVHGIYIYIKEDSSIWNHRAPIDCSWYWRKLNATKVQGWYNQAEYTLTQNGNYSITRSYLAIICQRPKMRTANLVWTSIALPTHRSMIWFVVQGSIFTQERKLTLHIQVDDTECCLCNTKLMETNVHLFEECKWIKLCGKRSISGQA